MEPLLLDVFEKAGRELGKKGVKPRAEHVAEFITEEYKYPISGKTLERYYRGISTPNLPVQQALAGYLGYEDFQDYRLDASSGSESKAERSSLFSAAFSGRAVIVLLGLLLGGMGILYLGILEKETCMEWINDHYEPTACRGSALEEPLREYKLAHFKKIKVSDTTTFFKNGKVQVWYDKSGKELSFFTAPGLHPENGKTLRPITQYMIEKYVLNHQDP